MLPAELERYLHEHIPLTRAMALGVVAITADAVILQAPLQPNINHRATVFGGSASALALLAGWALLHVRLHAEGIASQLVIQRNTMEFQRPIAGQFSAHASLQQPERWRDFTQMLARKGRARITVLALLKSADQLVGQFTGEFVALHESAG
jgi:thioesterase domain-containing protein